MEWIQSAIWEVKRSFSLKALGLLLALSHVLTFFEWSSSSSALFKESVGAPTCWPFLNNCAQAAILTPSQMEGFFFTFLMISIAAALCFPSLRLIGLGWFLLLVTFVMKNYVFLIDASLSGNHHVLLFFATFFFLFVPSKRRLLPLFFVTYFLFLSWQLISKDWLMGFAIQQEIPQVSVKASEWLAALSVLLLAVLPWGLLSRRRGQVIAATLGMGAYFVFQGYAFNSSEAFIGLGLLAYFWARFFESQNIAREQAYQSFLRPEPSKAWLGFGVLLFLGLQVSAEMFAPKGGAFPYQITVPPTPTECETYAFLKDGSNTKELITSFSPEEMECSISGFKRKKSQLCQGLEPLQEVMASFSLRKISQVKMQPFYLSTELCSGDNEL